MVNILNRVIVKKPYSISSLNRFAPTQSFFIQVPPDRARLRLPLEPDVPRPADPPHRHRQREGRRQGVPEGCGAGHPG